MRRNVIYEFRYPASIISPRATRIIESYFTKQTLTNAPHPIAEMRSQYSQNSPAIAAVDTADIAADSTIDPGCGLLSGIRTDG